MQLHIKNPIVRDLLLMLFFGILSYLLGFIQFKTSNVEGGTSNLIEIPLLVCVFYLSNPLYSIGTSLIVSFLTPEDGSYWSSFLMHVFPLILSWYVVGFLRKEIKNTIYLGLLWGVYVCIYYMVLVLPIFVITNPFFGLNTGSGFWELYFELGFQVRFELVSTTLITALYLVLMSAYAELKKHKDSLEQLVEARTKELKIANDKLKETIATKDKFFRIIGHDLRTPISQVIQFTEIIESSYHDMSEEDTLEFMSMLRESSIRGIKLLENLLEWAGSQTDAIKFEKLELNLHQLILENILLLEENATIKRINIHNRVDKNTRIQADRNMMHTVLRNLLSNAIKFTFEKGEIEIGANLKDSETQIYIKDSGIGIRAENLQKIFTIDFRHSALGTNNEKGTGIGLILCKEFVDKHGGRIWVESAIGKGSTFWVAIPN